MRALLIPIRDDNYALRLSAVREVVTAPEATALPTAPAAVQGLFNLRGDVIPLLDTAVLLGLPPLEDAAFAAVAETARGSVGLAATGRPEVCELPEDVMAAQGDAALGTYDLGDRLVTLVDADVLTLELVGAA